MTDREFSLTPALTETWTRERHISAVCLTNVYTVTGLASFLSLPTTWERAAYWKEMFIYSFAAGFLVSRDLGTLGQRRLP